MATCYRHPSRETAVSCSSCGRPICPDCMTSTPVGMRCPECAKQRTRVVRLRDATTVPRVTYGLIAANVAVFLTEGNFTLAGSASVNSVYLKGALLGSSAQPALAGQGVAHGQYWRIVTSAFLHENLLHIGFNMYILYLLGQMLEPALGSLKFAIIYGVSLLAGSFGALLLTPHSLTVGASGAIFGLMGAAVVEMRARQIPVLQSWVGGLIIINIVFSLTQPDISLGGHAFGFLGGLLTAAVMQAGARRRSQALAYAGCAAIALASVVGSVATSKSSEVEPVGAGPSTLLSPEP